MSRPCHCWGGPETREGQSPGWSSHSSSSAGLEQGWSRAGFGTPGVQLALLALHRTQPELLSQQPLQRLTGQAPWPAGRQVLEQPLHSKQMWDVEAAGRQRGAALWNRALEHVLVSSAGQAVPKDSSTSEELLAQSGTALVCIHGTSSQPSADSEIHLVLCSASEREETNIEFHTCLTSSDSL